MTRGHVPRIVVDEQPDPKVREEFLKPLRAINESQLGPIKAKPLATTLHHTKNNAVIAGLWGT